MKNKKTTFYKFRECSESFVYDDNKKKYVIVRTTDFSNTTNNTKKVVLNSMLAAFIISSVFYGFSFFKTNPNNIKATANTEIVEKLNSHSNELKEISKKVDSKYEIIINKANPIEEEKVNNYTQVEVENNLYDNVKIEEETYKQFLKLRENLKERNYYINIRSGFRTFKDSQDVYNSYSRDRGIEYAKKYVAEPGTSEHNTGLSFDFVVSTNPNSYSTDYNSDEYFYLENIAYLYGFIIRYPKDKENITGYSYEPWHLRYVGYDLAKYLRKNNLTLEEYYNN